MSIIINRLIILKKIITFLFLYSHINGQFSLPTFQAVNTVQTVSSSGSDILIIWDDSATNSNTLSLKSALENAGFTVTLSSTNESNYNGSNPSPSDYNVIIHLNGTTYGSTMPTSGQTALINFVSTQGGLYCHSEWTAYQGSNYSTMNEIILLTRTSGTTGSSIYTEVNSQSSHSILNNIPSSFTITGGFNIGPAKSFESNPVTVLMTQNTNGTISDAVVTRTVGNGKVIGMSLGGNYGGYNILSDTNVQQLFINAVNWAN